MARSVKVNARSKKSLRIGQGAGLHKQAHSFGVKKEEAVGSSVCFVRLQKAEAPV